MDEERKDDITAIKETLNQFVNCYNSGDVDRWTSLWADYGVEMPPSSPAIVGKEQIRKGMQPVFDKMNLDLVINSLDDVKASGDLGFARATYTYKMTPKAGGETINAMPDGKALILFERQSDGPWKIVYTCYSDNVPPAQTEKD